MRKALVVVLALMGLPLGLEAQTNLDLVNEVYAGRECSRRNPSTLSESVYTCRFTLGSDLMFRTDFMVPNRGPDIELFQIEYILPNNKYSLSAMMGEHSCITLSTSFNNSKYPSSTEIYISPRTGNVYGTGPRRTLEGALLECARDG